MIEALIAAAAVLVAGALLAPRVADYMVARPQTQQRMRTRAVVGVGAALGILSLASVVTWFLAAAFLTGTGCLWVAGYGGCVFGG